MHRSLPHIGIAGRAILMRYAALVTYSDSSDFRTIVCSATRSAGAVAGARRSALRASPSISTPFSHPPTRTRPIRENSSGAAHLHA